MTRARSGFTIVELLISAAILMLMLGALGSLFVGTNRAYSVNASITEGLGNVQGAIQSLRYDAGLAGYCGVTTACERLPDALTIVVDAAADACHDVSDLELRYVEDRFTGGAALQQRVVYELADDGQLLRGANGADTVAIAAGIDAFQFCGYRARSDAQGSLRFNRPDDGDLLGLEFRLTYRRTPTSSSTERFAVTLPNVP